LLRGFAVFGIACPTVTRCLTVGTFQRIGSLPASFRTTNGGVTWVRANLPGGAGAAYGDPVCPSATVCYASSATLGTPPAVIVTTDFGRTWRSVPVPWPTGSVTFWAFSCASIDACDAWVVAGSPSHNIQLPWLVQIKGEGTSFASARAPFQFFGGIVGFSCSTSLNCNAALDGQFTNAGHYVFKDLQTTDGGRTWARIPTPGVTGLVSPTCFATGACIGIGFGRKGSILRLTAN